MHTTTTQALATHDDGGKLLVVDKARDAVTRWAARSFEVLAGLSEAHPQSGVRMRAGL